MVIEGDLGPSCATSIFLVLQKRALRVYSGQYITAQVILRVDQPLGLIDNGFGPIRRQHDDAIAVRQNVIASVYCDLADSDR